MNKKVKLSYLIIVLCAFFLTFSLLHGYFSITARGWIWIPLACIMSLQLNTEVLRTRQFAWLVIYFIILSINILAGKSSNTTNYIILNFATLLWSFSFPFIIKSYVKTKFVRLFVITELFVIIITSFLTIIVDAKNPGIVRQTVTYINAGRADLALISYRLGVCEYGLPHAIPIIIPAILKYIRNKRISGFKRLIAISILVLLSYFVYVSGVTTAILLLGIAILGSLLINQMSLKKTYTRLIILFILALPFSSEDVILSSLSGVAAIVPVENSFHGKLISIENSIRYGESEGSVESREERYDISVKSFLENSLFGSSSGGHSVIIDNFGAYGLLGGIPFLLLIYFHLKNIYKIIPKDSKVFFLIGAVCFITMLASKNMSNVYTWLFVSALLPMLLFYEKNTQLK